MKMEGKYFVERIHLARKKKNIKVSEITSELQIGDKALNNWELRNTIPPADQVYKIAKMLDVSMLWLLTGEDENTSIREALLLKLFRNVSLEIQDTVINMLQFNQQEKCNQLLG